MQINIKLLDERATLPAYATSGAACFDIAALDAATVEAGSTQDFNTGLAFEVPEGHVMMVFSRSGHGFKHDVSLSNAVGVIDSDYRGELRVKLRNDGLRPFIVAAGDRIAQALIMPVFTVGFNRVSELSDTARGTGGFGSTDKPRTNGDLKVGQRVRLSPDHKWIHIKDNPVGIDGVVTGLDEYDVEVDWSNGHNNLYRREDSDLIPV